MGISAWEIALILLLALSAAVLAGIIFGAGALLGSRMRSEDRRARQDLVLAVDILDGRLARGEIDAEQYEEALRALSVIKGAH